MPPISYHSTLRVSMPNKRRQARTLLISNQTDRRTMRSRHLTTTYLIRNVFSTLCMPVLSLITTVFEFSPLRPLVGYEIQQLLFPRQQFATIISASTVLEPLQWVFGPFLFQGTSASLVQSTAHACTGYPCPYTRSISPPPGANCCGSCEQGHTTRCRIFLPLLLAIQHALSGHAFRGRGGGGGCFIH